MRKFQEILESSKLDEIGDKCENLFKQIWGDKFTIVKVKFYSLSYLTGYSKLYVKIFDKFNNKTYENYKDFFDYIYNLKLEFDFTSGQEISIYFNNPELFITEMETKISLNKYNL